MSYGDDILAKSRALHLYEWEIVAIQKKGILVGRLWYTYPVNPEQEDFSCTARNGIKIIENGKAAQDGL